MRKILISLLAIFTLFVGACSCDKFTIDTYEIAVSNFKESTGFEYTLKVTTKVEGQEYYEIEEYHNKYVLKTTGKVDKFASTLKISRVATPLNGPEGNPITAFTSERYYVGENNTFYEKDAEKGLPVETFAYADKSYEQMYSDINNKNNVNNLVPTFENELISGFEISEKGDKNGTSIAVFTGPVPSYLDSTEEVTAYSVTMDKDYYFQKIEFVVTDGEKTIEYEYNFLNYNSNVEIVFPNDLASY